MTPDAPALTVERFTIEAYAPRYIPPGHPDELEEVVLASAYDAQARQIESQAARIMELEQQSRGNWIDAEQLARDNEALREALRPFAALLAEHHERLPDSQPIFGINNAKFTVGDMRKARAALKET